MLSRVRSIRNIGKINKGKRSFFSASGDDKYGICFLGVFIILLHEFGSDDNTIYAYIFKERDEAIQKEMDAKKRQLIDEIPVNGLLLEQLTYFERTKDLCLAALKQNFRAFKYIPKYHKDIEMYEYVVSKCGEYIQYVPYKLLSNKLCKISMQDDIHNFKYVVKYLRSNNEFEYKNAIIEHNVLIDYIHPLDHEYQYVKNLLGTSDVDAAHIYLQSCIRKQEKCLKDCNVSHFKYLSNNDILSNIPIDVVSKLDINKLQGLVLTGAQYKKYFSHVKQHKVINHKYNSFDHMYKMGHNDVTDNFDLFRLHDKDMVVTSNPNDWVGTLHCRDRNCMISKATFPNDAIVIIKGCGNVKANLLILDKFEEFKC